MIVPKIFYPLKMADGWYCGWYQSFRVESGSVVMQQGQHLEIKLLPDGKVIGPFDSENEAWESWYEYVR